MKNLAIGLVCALAIWTGVMYSDNISYSWTPTNTDSLTVSRYKADRSAVSNVVNGNLTNGNIKATANIGQSKLDSTGGWITNRDSSVYGTEQIKIRSYTAVLTPTDTTSGYRDITISSINTGKIRGLKSCIKDTSTGIVYTQEDNNTGYWNYARINSTTQARIVFDNTSAFTDGDTASLIIFVAQ